MSPDVFLEGDLDHVPDVDRAHPSTQQQNWPVPSKAPEQINNLDFQHDKL